MTKCLTSGVGLAAAKAEASQHGHPVTRPALMLPRDSLREECIETLREAYSDVSLSRPDKFPIRTAIIRSQEAEWISPLLMQDIEQTPLPDGDTSKVRDVVNILGRLGVTEALLPIEKLFNTLCREHPQILEPEWYFCITECGEALARLGKEHVLPLLTNPPELPDEESQPIVQMAFWEMRHLAGDSTAFHECLKLALEHPDSEYVDLALKILPDSQCGADATAFLERFLTSPSTASFRRLEAATVAVDRQIRDLTPAILQAFQDERYCCHKI